MHNTPAKVSFRPGDMVVLKSPREILATLDDSGASAGLPFMPEMLTYFGRRMKVSRKVEKTCVDGSPEGMREFRNNDVYFLEEFRCDGSAHGNCGRACMLFWKEGWLQAAGAAAPPLPTAEEMELLHRRLLTKKDGGKYYCQSSDLDDATQSLSRRGRVWKSFRNVIVGNNSVWGLVKSYVKPGWARLYLRFTSRWPVGPPGKTATDTLNLQPGEWVEVKSLAEISATLDETGKNRGLQFAYDLAWCCGRRFKVRSRLDHMVLERTGKYLDVRNTVLLEGITCPCRCVMGGCGRADYIYWREIWLRRVSAPSTNTTPVPGAPGFSGKSEPVPEPAGVSACARCTIQG